MNDYKLNDGEKAIEHYDEFLSLWKDADQGTAEVDGRKRGF